MPDLAERLADVDARIAAAMRASGRARGEVTRIVVTKFHPPELVAELHALGVRDVGENRQQELSAKRDALGGLEGLRWHFIGQAQTNKARAVRSSADAVHSVDRVRIADALHAADPTGAPLDVLVQVNLTSDAGRGGAPTDQVETLAAHIAESCPSLRLRGVMAVAPLDEEPAAAFERLAAASLALRAVVPAATWISAGMTGDFVEAISAGATHLRIGSAITGPRPDRG
ncbi:YggS family pyridoxal phosphate-dependent enzyme [Microbacterium oleivorans]|uniref:Pyridoxal phosphate homeostasis protein n=1 Tax=Microbacterium oleivorans TaxID=273677 RepID=A0A7D5EY09_9MICO|nr:YggS family pyridoxal phosphate-dependent enzyme [Microbacterium oleivorans]QLD12866.1 YggS family pyridoxal phosphate-dependent enzyme [Microbacterium oleivorans]